MVAAPSCMLPTMIKGASARDVNLRRAFAHAIVWQAGYWAESLGPPDQSPLVAYVRNQRRRHDDSHPAERWQTDNCDAL